MVLTVFSQGNHGIQMEELNDDEQTEVLKYASAARSAGTPLRTVASMVLRKHGVLLVPHHANWLSRLPSGPLKPLAQRYDDLHELRGMYDREDVHARLLNDRRFVWSAYNPFQTIDRAWEAQGILDGTVEADALAQKGNKVGCCYLCRLSAPRIREWSRGGRLLVHRPPPQRPHQPHLLRSLPSARRILH